METTQNNKDRYTYLKNQSNRTALSLAKAVQDAGGCVLTYEQLRHITAMELLDIISPNNIIFVYSKEKN